VNVKRCYWEEISWIPERYDTEYARFVKRKKPETWFKAVDGGVVLGIGCLLHISLTTVRLSNAFVLPEYRNKGVIKEIVKGRERWARINGFKKIDVRTVKKYYESLGYVRIKDYKTGGAWYVKNLT